MVSFTSIICVKPTSCQWFSTMLFCCSFSLKQSWFVTLGWLLLSGCCRKKVALKALLVHKDCQHGTRQTSFELAQVPGTTKTDPEVVKNESGRSTLVRKGFRNFCFIKRFLLSSHLEVAKWPGCARSNPDVAFKNLKTKINKAALLQSNVYNGCNV